MRIYEITTIKPIKQPTPVQVRINALKQQKDRTNDALKAERERQRLQKANLNLQSAQQALTKARVA